MAKTTNSDKIRAASDRSLFLMLDYDFIETPLLTLHEKAVYVVLRKFAGSKDSCFPAVSTIAKQAQVSRVKVHACLNSLEEKGIIRRENRFNDDTGGRTSNIYTILDKNRIWKSKTLEEMRTAANETELDYFRRRLEQAGYSVTKEKVPTSETGELTEVGTHTQDHHNNDNSENQAKRYKLTDIYDLYQYSGIVQQYPELKDNVDEQIVEHLEDAIKKLAEVEVLIEWNRTINDKQIENLLLQGEQKIFDANEERKSAQTVIGNIEKLKSGQDELISKKEAKILLGGVSDATLWRWEKEGYLIPERFGRKIMYRKSKIQGLMIKR